MAAGQMEFALPEETPFDALASTLLNRTAEMFDLHLGMTLSEYQNRWLDIVDVANGSDGGSQCAESVRLHKLAKGKLAPASAAAGRPRRGRWTVSSAGALRAAEAWFLNATEPLMAAYEARFPR